MFSKVSTGTLGGGWGYQLRWLLHRRLLIHFGERGDKVSTGTLGGVTGTSFIGCNLYRAGCRCPITRFWCLHDIFVRRVGSVVAGSNVVVVVVAVSGLPCCLRTCCDCSIREC